MVPQSIVVNNDNSSSDDETFVVGEIKKPVSSATTFRKPILNLAYFNHCQNNGNGNSNLGRLCTRCNNPGHSSDRCRIACNDLHCQRCDKCGHIQKIAMLPLITHVK